MEFETHRCMSPIVLFLILLEDKKKSKSMGEFDKCTIFMGNLDDLGLKFGINLH